MTSPIFNFLSLFNFATLSLIGFCGKITRMVRVKGFYLTVAFDIPLDILFCVFICNVLALLILKRGSVKSFLVRSPFH